jgi:hypothetical protein
MQSESAARRSKAASVRADPAAAGTCVMLELRASLLWKAILLKKRDQILQDAHCCVVSVRKHVHYQGVMWRVGICWQIPEHVWNDNGRYFYQN